MFYCLTFVNNTRSNVVAFAATTIDITGISIAAIIICDDNDNDTSIDVALIMRYEKKNITSNSWK